MRLRKIYHLLEGLEVILLEVAHTTEKLTLRLG